MGFFSVAAEDDQKDRRPQKPGTHPRFLVTPEVPCSASEASSPRSPPSGSPPPSSRRLPPLPLLRTLTEASELLLKRLLAGPLLRMFLLAELFARPLLDRPS